MRLLSGRTTALILVAAGLLLDPAAAEPASVGWSEPIRVARGAAYVGPWRMNDSEWRYVDDPTVAMDEQGRIAVAWVDQSRRDVFFRLHDSAGDALGSEPVNVSRSPRVFSWLPRMATAPGGRVYLLWQEIVFSGGSHGGEAFFAYSSDGGQSFSEPVNLSNSRAGDGKGRLDAKTWHNGSLDLARAGDGTLYAAWTEYEGRLWLARSGDEGKTFSEPLLVAGDADDQPARGPALATAPGGRVYLAWTVGEDPAADIHLAVSEDNGQRFGAPRTVGSGPGHADAPKLAVDGEGTLHLVYGESPAGPMQRYGLRYARSRDGGATFTQPRNIAATIPEPYASANFPGLAVDDNGDVYVLAHLSPAGGRRPRALGLTVSTDGGRTFVPLSMIPGITDPAEGIAGSLQGLLVSKLDVGDAGKVVVINSTFVQGQDSGIRFVMGRR